MLGGWARNEKEGARARPARREWRTSTHGMEGGVENTIKTGKKYGTLFYLAQWQGIRGEHLDIDLDLEHELVCSRTGVKVIFTGDLKKYGSA